MRKTLNLIMGNQLFPLEYYRRDHGHFFMCEDVELCRYFKFHKHKIIHFLASMRNFRDLLVANGFEISYFQIEERTQFFNRLLETIRENAFSVIECYEIEDAPFEKSLRRFCHEHQIQLHTKPSPMFLSSRKNFEDYLSGVKKPFLKSFYEQERKRLQILVEQDAPVGGQWSYDQDNRKKIPKNFTVTDSLPDFQTSEAHVEDVSKIVESLFPTHPGSVENFWIPVTRKKALEFMNRYFEERFEYFGTYQDALDRRNPFLYHSLLSPLLNIGLLLPNEVITRCLESFERGVALNTVEGFVRQVIGWREFLRGIYQNYGQRQMKTNFFGHERGLSDAWYSAETRIPIVDYAIEKCNKWGYCHHIERLMVLSNLMLLLEVHPKEVYKWFMEMFVDSSDWVMAPNVFGMGQFSDGGVFATKPYVCGSNYWLKMSHEKKGDWCLGVDGLYWNFIDKKRDFLAGNHRLSMMLHQLKKIDPEKRKVMNSEAAKLVDRLTVPTSQFH